MASAVDREFIEAVAAEVSGGIHSALNCWLGRIERVLEARTLTTLGRLQAVQEIVAEYKRITGQVNLECRTVPRIRHMQAPQ
jgi:hypothetical protein